jgi:hypothetical protein
LPQQHSIPAAHPRSSKIHRRNQQDLPARTSPDPRTDRQPKFLTPGHSTLSKDNFLAQDIKHPDVEKTS